jgi:hypothetical protein
MSHCGASAALADSADRGFRGQGERLGWISSCLGERGTERETAFPFPNTLIIIVDDSDLEMAKDAFAH